MFVARGGGMLTFHSQKCLESFVAGLARPVPVSGVDRSTRGDPNKPAQVVGSASNPLTRLELELPRMDGFRHVIVPEINCCGVSHHSLL